MLVNKNDQGQRESHYDSSSIIQKEPEVQNSASKKESQSESFESTVTKEETTSNEDDLPF